MYTNHRKSLVSYGFLISEERLSQLHKGDSGRLSRYRSTARTLSLSYHHISTIICKVTVSPEEVKEVLRYAKVCELLANMVDQNNHELSIECTLLDTIDMACYGYNNFTQCSKYWYKNSLNQLIKYIKKQTNKHETCILFWVSVAVVSCENLVSEERLSQLHKGDSWRLSRYWSTAWTL